MHIARYPPIVVMGAQGSGKTTVGVALAERLNAAFIDADDFHPEANQAKMAAGTPLDDEDRVPWLEAVGRAIATRRSQGVVAACSALRRRYRDLLRSRTPDLVFVHLTGSRELLAERIARRRHAFMPPDLLDSQLDTLEPLGDDEKGFDLSIALSPALIVERIVGELWR